MGFDSLFSFETFVAKSHTASDDCEKWATTQTSQPIGNKRSRPNSRYGGSESIFVRIFSVD